MLHIHWCHHYNVDDFSDEPDFNINFARAGLAYVGRVCTVLVGPPSVIK